MIRGVNKNIIEISDTGNDCFERAILFIRPESASQGNDLVRKRAQKYLSSLRFRPLSQHKYRYIFGFLRLLAAAVVGAMITALLLHLI